MSGHSKWATIRRDKEHNDSKKGATFTKFSKDISSATKQGGGDPEMNALLAATIIKAKAANMPNDKIQKAIDRGAGISKSGQTISSFSYDAYGPGDVGIVIDGSTDNKNRTVSEIKMILDRNGGHFVEGGAVSWLFESKGYIQLLWETEEATKNRNSSKWNNEKGFHKLDKSTWELFQLEVIDQEGVIDIEEDEFGINLYLTPDSVGRVRSFLESKNIDVEDADIIKVPKASITVSDEDEKKVMDLVLKLRDNDDVENVWNTLE